MKKKLEGELIIEAGEALHRWEEGRPSIDLKTENAILRVYKDRSNKEAYEKLEQLCGKLGMRIKAEADYNLFHILRRVEGKIILGKGHYCFEYKRYCLVDFKQTK